jgi:ribosomal protein S18 acetylase RimI-like enzyme
MSLFDAKAPAGANAKAHAQSGIAVRVMRTQDLPAVLAIQATCYTQIEPESRLAFESKLAASPDSCFIAELGGCVVGYLMALPWELSGPPALHLETCRLPPVPDCLYLHDLAVEPAARAAGTGKALVDAFFAHLRSTELGRASLVAIQDSIAYWQRHGFSAVQPTHALRAKLASYGENVHYMVLGDGHDAPKK